jgi:hypothetical protein
MREPGQAGPPVTGRCRQNAGRVGELTGATQVIGDGGSAIHEPSQHAATQGHGGHPPSAGIGVGPGEGRRIADRYHERVSPGKLAVGAQTEQTHRPVHQQPCSGRADGRRRRLKSPPAFNLQKVAPRDRGIEWVGETPLDPADHAGEAPEPAGLRTRTVHSRALGATPPRRGRCPWRRRCRHVAAMAVAVATGLLVPAAQRPARLSGWRPGRSSKRARVGRGEGCAGAGPMGVGPPGWGAGCPRPRRPRWPRGLIRRRFGARPGSPPTGWTARLTWPTGRCKRLAAARWRRCRRRGRRRCGRRWSRLARSGCSRASARCRRCRPGPTTSSCWRPWPRLRRMGTGGSRRSRSAAPRSGGSSWTGRERSCPLVPGR